MKRADWREFKKILDLHGITSLYHFTDRDNIKYIIDNGGLYSWKDCEEKGIDIPKPGGGDLSRRLDVKSGLQHYVRLSFTRQHPMMYAALHEGRITNPVILEIDLEVLYEDSTKYADCNATRNEAQVGGTLSDFKNIHFDSVTQKKHFDLDPDEQPFYQAEVLVKNFIPLEYIRNISDFGIPLPNNLTKLESKTEPHPVIQELLDSMVYVEGGSFIMGVTPEQMGDAYDLEKPAHWVTLSSFCISKYEVTQALWEHVMGDNPSKFEHNARRPVESVSWNDCQEFIDKLNKETGKKFRLPTEAEWEYAARGGKKAKGYKYSGSDKLDDVAWYGNNSGGETHPVGKKKPNELGLYDMSGNVLEWCQDWLVKYRAVAQTNPKGPESGDRRVLRGGCWYVDAMICRCSFRGGINPGCRNFILGLRLVLSEVATKACASDEELEKKRLIQELLDSMVYVEGGSFIMGATPEQMGDASDGEKPSHWVTLSSFRISKYEVTQALWKHVMGINPSLFKGDARRPVECVSWNDCQEFIDKLNKKTGKRFRLPTEAEWEYAARGGSKTRGYKYSGSDDLDDVAWYVKSWESLDDFPRFGRSTHPVGQKKPNELGLYDMSGNVFEWCQDWHGNYSDVPQTNPKGPESGDGYVCRGGARHIDGRYCRCSSRGRGKPDSRTFACGLRLVLSE